MSVSSSQHQVASRKQWQKADKSSIQRQSQARSPGLWPLGKEEPVTDVELINAIKMDFNRVWHRSAAGSLEGTRAHEANVRQLEVGQQQLGSPHRANA